MLILRVDSVTVQLPIISVKKNPQNPMYTQVSRINFYVEFVDANSNVESTLSLQKFS
jgi:hypothetical protein